MGLVLLAALTGCAQTEQPPAATNQAATPVLADVADADAATRSTDPLLRTAAVDGPADGRTAAPAVLRDPAPRADAARGTASAGPRLVLTPLALDQWSRTATTDAPREPAPMPNRGLDPPFSLPTSDPSFAPTLMRPGAGPDPSAALGPGHPLSRDDRQFQQPAAGARFRLPFTN